MVCDCTLLQESAEQYNETKSDIPPPTLQNLPSPDSKAGSSASGTEEDISPEKSWKWTGSNFAQSPTTEPWVMSNTIYRTNSNNMGSAL